MFTLILLTFSVFFVFWLGDLYLTKKTVNKIGTGAEFNPLMRRILQVRGRFIWIFKTVEIGLFLYLLYFLTILGNATIPFYVLLGYILLYGILVANNSGVYFKVTGKESVAFRYIFITAMIILILFIYLNFYIYSGLVLSYDSLQTCQSGYSQLAWECNQTTIVDNLTNQLDNILNSLNIPIPRPW